MAFDKYANAHVRSAGLKPGDWRRLRKSAVDAGASRRKTASVDFSDFNPNKYLLTHATIIASVDVDDVEGVNTGKVSSGGQSIYRPHSDYYVTPKTAQFVNHNGDCWERKLLLSTYRTFVGAENYVEHVQVPELSKGKVVDAVARDLGDTVYVDILVATDRKHASLVDDIVSGRISTLSMGCTISYSVCTRCGNVARDDEDLCDHVRSQKGQKFIDENGTERVIAELCGHHTDPKSVKFIEASWVANPAFEGAVMRSVLNPNIGDVSDGVESMGMSSLIQRAYTMSSINQHSHNLDDFFKTASAEPHMFGPGPSSLGVVSEDLRNVAAFGRDDSDDGGGEEEDKGFFEQVVDETKTEVQKRLLNEIKDELTDQGEAPTSEEMPEAESEPNNSIIESRLDLEHAVASCVPDSFTRARVMEALKKEALSGEGLSQDFRVTAMYLRDATELGKRAADMINQCVSRVGAYDGQDPLEYLTKCAFILGRIPRGRECLTVLERASEIAHQ